MNLLPYSVYKQLGLGELKPTNITLSLADDRSVKIPKGIVEDVLVKVDKFYYPVDFVVLDTEPIEKGPIMCQLSWKTIFGHCQCNHQLLKWSHAAHIWQHDIGAEHISLEQQAQAGGN